MKNRTIRLFCATLVLVLLCAAFSTTALAAPTTGSLLDYQKSVAISCNIARKANNAPALALDTQLCTIALALAMEQEGYTGESGKRPNGKEWASILSDYAYSYVEVGFNVLASDKNLTSTKLADAWLGDSVFAKTVNYSRYTYTGLNKYYSKADNCNYYVQIFARPVTSSTEAPANTKVAYEAIATSTVNVRAGASTKFEVTGVLGKDQRVRVASVSGKWAKIFWDNSAYAYVHTSYLKKTLSLGAATATGKVNVREGAGTEFKALGTLAKKETVNILSFSGTWAQIEWNGQTGYVSIQYLKQ